MPPAHVQPAPRIRTLPSFLRLGVQTRGNEAWHRHSAEVPAFPAQEPQRAAGMCLPVTFCIIVSHLLSGDRAILRSQPQQEMVLGICHFRNSREKQGGEGVWSAPDCAARRKGGTGEPGSSGAKAGRTSFISGITGLLFTSHRAGLPALEI